MSRHSKKIKGTVRPPSTAIMLSLLAVILVTGAPALVSMIDDSRTVDVLESVDLDEKIILKSGSMFFKNTAPEGINKNYSHQLDEENNNYIFSMNNINSAEYVTGLPILQIDKSVFAKNMYKIIVTVEGTEIDKLRLSTSSSNGASYIQHIFTKIGENVYELNLSELEAIRLATHPNPVDFTVLFSDDVIFSGVMSLSYEIYTESTVPYADFILGGVGIVLLICALFATPWFGFGGIQKKAKARRR